MGKQSEFEQNNTAPDNDKLYETMLKTRPSPHNATASIHLTSVKQTTELHRGMFRHNKGRGY